MALDKLTKLTTQSGISTTIDYTMSDLIVDTISIRSGGGGIGGGGNVNAGIVTCTQLDLNGNGDISGDLVVGGNLTANGDFTTLNTTLREVELLRVDANASTAAGIITQRGSGDILNLFDTTTEVFKIADGGAATFGSTLTIPSKIIHTGDTGTFMNFNTDEIVFETGAASKVFINDAGDLTVGASEGNLGKVFIKQAADSDTEGFALLNAGGGNSFRLFLGDSSGTVAHIGHGGQKQLNITQAGRVGINDATGNARLIVKGNSDTDDADCQIRIYDTDSTAGSQIPSVSFWGGSTEIGRIRGTDTTGMHFYTANSGTLTSKVNIAPAGQVLIGETATSGMSAYDLGMKNNTAIRFRKADGSAWINSVGLDNSNNLKLGWGGSVDEIHFGIAGIGEQAKFDSGGRLLIGYTASQAVYSTSALQVQGTTAATSSVSLLRHNGSPYLSLGATGGSSLGGVAAVSADDRLGQLTFVGADGTDVNTHACSIAGYVDGSVSGNTVPGRLVFKCSTGAGEPERMRITSGGYVNIGGNYTQTTNTLNVTGNIKSTTRFNLNDAVYLWQQNRMSLGNSFIIESQQNTPFAILTQAVAQPIVFGTNSTERLRIQSDGKVWLDKGNPVGSSDIILDKAGTGGATLRFYNAGTQKGYIQLDPNELMNYYGAASVSHEFYAGGSSALKIESNGRVLIGDAQTYGANGDLHIVGDTNSNGPELYLVVNNNNTTDNIGAILFGNNGDKSLVKLSSHTHTASNTSDFAISTSNAGSMAEALRINSSGNVSIGDVNAYDNYATNNQATKFAVAINSGSGWHETANFASGGDNNNTGAVLRVGHYANDRGLYIKAGRENSDRAISHFGLRNSSNSDTTMLTLHQDGGTHRVHFFDGGAGGLEPVNIVGAGGGIQIARVTGGTSPTSGQVLGSLAFQGYLNGNGASSADCRIEALASENHSGSTAGSELHFRVKSIGTGPGSSGQLAAKLQNDKTLTLYNHIYLERSGGDPKIYAPSNVGVNIEGQALYLNRWTSSDINMCQGGGGVNVSNTTNAHSSLDIFKASGNDANKAMLRIGYDASNSLEISRPRASGTILVNSQQSGSYIQFRTESKDVAFMTPTQVFAVAKANIKTYGMSPVTSATFGERAVTKFIMNFYSGNTTTTYHFCRQISQEDWGFDDMEIKQSRYQYSPDSGDKASRRYYTWYSAHTEHVINYNQKGGTSSGNAANWIGKNQNLGPGSAFKIHENSNGGYYRDCWATDYYVTCGNYIGVRLEITVWSASGIYDTGNYATASDMYPATFGGQATQSAADNWGGPRGSWFNTVTMGTGSGPCPGVLGTWSTGSNYGTPET